MFYLKGTLCPKKKGQHNPIWLANEIVYAAFAEAAHLRMPAVCLLSYHGSYYFGSESLPGRNTLEALKPNLTTVMQIGDNLAQLVRAFLLDLALLNSDRTIKQVLVDKDGLLWFIDHDKSLWGDGHS